MADKRFRSIVSGRVQGVCFRAATEDEAYILGVKGIVKNRSDNSVEVVVEGEEAVLTKLLEWLYHGPTSAVVTEVKTVWEEPTGEYTDFRVVY